MSHQYSAIGGTEIRLIELLPGHFHEPLRCEMILCSPSSGSEGPHYPNYEALSYVWGDQTNPESITIVQTGSNATGTMQVGRNLVSALRHMRLTHSKRTIWCDFICINQADLREREREVARMATIYREAQRVVAWLGEEADDSQLAMNVIENTGLNVEVDLKRRIWIAVHSADQSFSRSAQTPPYSERELRAVEMLLDRPWFKRLWVRQEVTLAKRCVVATGHHTASWSSLLATTWFIDSFVRLRARTYTEFARNLFNVCEFGSLKTHQETMEILHACRACECGNDRDRVYGLLGILPSNLATYIQPNYSNDVKDVYKDLFMQTFRREQRLDILSLCENATTPSWVPDLQSLGLDTGLNTRVCQYSSATGQAAAFLRLVNHNTIEVIGVRCGVIGGSITTLMDRDCNRETLKNEIIRILREHLGNDVSKWDATKLDIMAKGLLGCIWFERTGRENHSSLSFATQEFANWARKANDPKSWEPEEGESLTLLNHVIRVLFQRDSCRWLEDGHLGLGHNACQQGDILFAIIGCRRLMVLRKDNQRDVHRVIGKFDHPAYMDGEAILGQLPPGWKATYTHGLHASNRPKFVHENGLSQWQDPRMRFAPLPLGWHEKQDSNGCPYWFHVGRDDERSYVDPRLTYMELKKRDAMVVHLIIE